MFFIQQTSGYDCGFTCLKILLANIHHDKDYLFLSSPFDKDTSFLELINEASKYQVNLVPLRAVDRTMLRNNKDFPFIARVTINNMSHALYVYKMNKKYIFYYDPARGQKKIYIDEFISMWSGELLIIKEFSKHPCPIKKMKLMTVQETIISLAISLITTVSSILAIYFINKESYIYLPIIFFSVMLIGEIMQKKYSIIICRHIDNRIEEKVNEVKKNEYYEFYKDNEGFKKYLLINNLTIFYSFSIFLIISLIFIINDKINFIYIVMNLLLAFAYSLFIRPELNKEESEISELEASIKTKNDKLEAFSMMNEARSKGYKYVSTEYAYKYVAIALEVILTFILMMYNKIVNVTYIICYSVLQIYLYNNLVVLLTSNETSSKQDNYLNKITNFIINK